MRSVFFITVVILLIAMPSCNRKGNTHEEEKLQTRTPVTVTTVSKGILTDTVELNAVSSFLLKTNVKANTNGYLQEVNIKLGENIARGQVLFQIKSKEATTLGNMINKVDTAFHFKGITMIKSPGNGYITQLTYQAGDYVQDGETLATISDVNSLVFLLDLPYELKAYISKNKHVILSLPDGEKISGTLSSALPFVDPISQTQSYIIRMDHYQSIPENLIAKVIFIRNAVSNAISVPKESVLTNEQQTEFWIMKMINDSIAVKVPITKGIETSSRIEVASPEFSSTDKILLTGNYGLPDTAMVMIEIRK